MSEVKHPGLIVPIEQISQEALNGLIEEFVLREGTDYGAQEYSLEQKNKQVIQQLKTGAALVVFNPVEDSCTIIRKEDLRRSSSEEN